jgi:hypothetical protein
MNLFTLRGSKLRSHRYSSQELDLVDLAIVSGVARCCGHVMARENELLLGPHGKIQCDRVCARYKPKRPAKLVRAKNN